MSFLEAYGQQCLERLRECQQRVFVNDRYLMALGGPRAYVERPELREEMERIQADSKAANEVGHANYMVALTIFASRDKRMMKSKQ